MNDSKTEIPLSVDQESQLSRIAFKAPAFWENDPELWFFQVESQFLLAGISNDSTKFHAVIAALNSNILSCVRDLLGDKRPSHLLSEMRNLAPSKLEDDLLQTLWLERLPANLQQVLSVCKAPLDELTQIADKVHEVSGSDLTVARIETKSNQIELDVLKAEIADLKNMVKKLTVSAYSPNRNGYRSRSLTSSRGFDKNKARSKRLCWHHFHFADKVRPSSRLFITDLVTRNKFLIDSGAAVSCYPKRLTKFSVKQDLELYAANGSRISTYGIIKLELDFFFFGLRRSFPWSFLVADVSDPIIGADFLERFELLIDVRNRRLLDGLTSLFVRGTVKQVQSLGLTLVENNSP
ncbi:transposon Ty3-I Gag-Pol polyprotein [Trichonephila clavipes]|nr:transposon Ty3-I Gag-Pol polyprotein [Trichonephila clavipes]